MMLKGLKAKVLGAPPPEEPPRPAPPETSPAPEIRVRRLEDKSSPDDSVISAHSALKGEISGPTGARIAGEMQGDIRCEGLVWIKETGRVRGNVYSAYVILEGTLEGDIGPSLQVELRAKARMRGNVKTKVLAMAEGSQFQGRIDMATSSSQPARFTEKRQPKPGRK